MSTAYQIVVCAGIVPDPLQTLEPVAPPTRPTLKNEMMLPAVLDPWAGHALYEAANLAKNAPGSTLMDWLLPGRSRWTARSRSRSPTDSWPAAGDFFNVLSYASRAGGFASSSAGALGLTESYTPNSLLLTAGSNAFPSLAFTAAGGNTQTVCVPFQLLATAVDVDGAAIASGNPESFRGCPTVELDFLGAYTFTARGTSWVTQAVTLAAYPLHWIISGGFRTNGAFKLCLAGETGRVYHVLGSTNLGATNWVVIGVMESTNGIWRFLVTGASNQPFRFYRAVQLP